MSIKIEKDFFIVWSTFSKISAESPFISLMFFIKKSNFEIKNIIQKFNTYHLVSK